MTFPVLGANGAVGGYAIDNSLRFDESAPSYLSRTPASAGNRKTFTHSTWVKFSGKYGGRGGSLLNANGSSASTNFIYGIDVNTTGNASGSPDHALYIHSYAGDVITTSRLLRDYSSWYHIVLAVDTTQSTATDRIKLYINGELQSYTQGTNFPSQNDDFGINDSRSHDIGSDAGSADYNFGGYMAEMHLVDGQALSPTDFGEFDEDSGIWKPIQYTGTYGTNGFYLDFENSGSLGADQSGNGNNFTPTNLASTDQTTDTPTNNWVVVNNLDKGQSNASYMMNLSEGNLKISGEAESSSARASGFIMSAGKWYWEVCLISAGIFQVVGIDASNSDLTTEGTGLDANSIGYFSHTGLTRRGGTATTSGSAWTTTGDIIGIAYDGDNGTLNFYKNNSLQSNNYTGLTEDFWMPSFASRNGSMVVNFGQDGSFAGNKTAQGNSDGNGFGDFYYAPPSGYLALCTQNLATALSPTIDDGSQYFNTVLTTGAGAGSYTGVGFQPDFLWFKRRDSSGPHFLIDSTRGSSKYLASESTASETTDATFLTSIDSDGWTGGSGFYGSPATLATWNWKANGGTTSSNTDGSITSTVQANTTAGFSIVTYTGTGSNATVGHGLGIAPKMIIVKNRSNSTNWRVHHNSVGATKILYFNLTNSETVSDIFQNTLPTSSVFSVSGNNDVNGSSDNMIAYCFSEIEVYSKFGRYTGNGSSDGPMINLSFRPAFVIVKRTDSSGNWVIVDNKINDFNLADNWLYADLSNSEGNGSGAGLDLISNGFKMRNTFNSFNASGGTYVYMAFAENPFVSSTGIPVTAR